MTKVSVITPTADRPHFIDGLYSLLKKQTLTDWEWLICDTSLAPQTFADPRVVYLHESDIISIGEKRNRLIEKAQGQIIVHCDDDDYYSPSYLAYVYEKLQKAAFFNLHSWFSHDIKSKQTFYWSTEEEHQSQYIVSPMSGARIREVDFGSNLENQKEKLNYKGRYGYGFSFAYRKEVARTCSFHDCDFAEDRKFYQEVEKAGFPLLMEADQEGRAIHVIHDTNTSSEFPQYRLPAFVAEALFPDFFSYVRQIHET